MLISAVGENLDSKAHAENLEGSFFVLKFEHFFDLEAIFVHRNDEFEKV
jgi:hypothetical protein